MVILGLNAYHGDASAALLVDGQLVCAIEEERLNRRKHCAGFPSLAARACLEMAGLRAADIDHVALSRDPKAHLLHKALHVASRVAAGGEGVLGTLRDRLGNVARLRRSEEALATALGVTPGALRARHHAVEHHRAHLASTFFVSPFEEAAVLSLDGFGDFVSTMWGHGRGERIEVLGEVLYPHSLGILYTAVTQWLGFPNYGDEGKVMGLAPYGKPRYLAEFRRLVTLLPDGGFVLNPEYFRHVREGVEMTWDEGTPHIGGLYTQRLIELLGPPREPGGEYTERVCDVAASLQATLEEAVLHLCRALHRQTGQRRLCLAGGVALNSVANGKILDHTPFEELFIQPAAGDGGTSLGAALWVQHQELGRPRSVIMEHAYTGPAFSAQQCAAAVAELLPDPASAGIRIERLEPEEVLIRRTVDAIERGAVVGWFQGRMEFGPRALGNRSIVVDPRRADMKDRLNNRIKHRESFRPFAPAILEEETAAWFVRAAPAPTMLLVDLVRPERRAAIPAVTHVDGSGRLQTVSRRTNPLFHALISEFARRTGVPVLLNTSFNENEPIVCTPQDALHCFLKTQMDALALGPLLLERTS
ncbi:MAG: carbamoyltransferase C-terminal domain-containing protein [Myxococcales bacterium]|nr:carbamoyltransferase [Myxococcota bacterium]MDW8280166.1 carbamoyltransferase C-terminal domain-containing protein [Myxococcales bacterium]